MQVLWGGGPIFRYILIRIGPKIAFTQKTQKWLIHFKWENVQKNTSLPKKYHYLAPRDNFENLPFDIARIAPLRMFVKLN